jgi:hypothetical protein
MNKQTWYRFAAEMLRTRDIDPVYPVLKALNEQEPAEDALWRTFCYVALYHLGASEVLFYATAGLRTAPQLDTELVHDLAPRAGIERRGLRTGAFLEAHLRAILANRERFGTFEGWLTTGQGDEPRERWRETARRLEAVAHNGRWASYKTCDILVETHGWPMEAPDAGHRFSSGPREGLAKLVEDGILDAELPPHTDQSEGALALLDRATERVQRDLWAEGIPAKVSEVETLLCNWKSLRQRRYYVGHDTDEMLERVLWLHDRGEMLLYRRLLNARRAALPVETLGEVQGWAGIRKELMGRV